MAVKSRRTGGGGDYDVGYGKPPVEGQFKPGQSGNPSGRRKVPPSPTTVFHKLLNRTVLVTERGRQRPITMLEAAFTGIINGTVHRDPKAVRAFLQLLQRFPPADQGAEPALGEQLSDQDAEILARFLDDYATGVPSPGRKSKS